MSHGLSSALLLGLALPLPAAACEVIHLDPGSSAVAHARSRGLDPAQIVTRRPPELLTLRPSPGEGGLSAPVLPQKPTPARSFQELVTHDAEPGGLAYRLRRLRDKLFIEVTAYEAGSSSKRWEGLDEGKDDHRGRTLDLAGGRFSGDLSVGIGAEAGAVSLSDLTSGTLDVYAVNPIRDISAQFDFLVRVSAERPGPGFDAFIIRARAAYLDAFQGQNVESSPDTEYTLSVGLSW